MTRTASTTATMERRAGLAIAEYDKAGNLRARYVESNSTKAASRVDILLPAERKQLWRQILNIFLPDGYPQSVTEDYTPYQIYDSFQAFAGTIAGMISSRAVWEGLGVGDSTASPTGAMLIQVIRECMGKLSTIFFAHLMGTSIEAECKSYRLASDVLCDTAMILDCASPWFPTSVRFLCLGISSVLYAASGVAGNASKSSLSGHFAKWNNLGELNAKDGSQETVISLMGMMTGTLVVSFLSTPTLTWTVLIALLISHLIMNRKGVRAVNMRSLNRQRANIIFSHLVEEDKVLTTKEVSIRELIFERRGGAVYRWNNGEMIGHCQYGVSLKLLLRFLSQKDAHRKTGALHLEAIDLTALTDLFQSQQYLLWCRTFTPSPYTSAGSQTKIVIVLKEGVSPQSQLRAWYHGLLLSWRLHNELGGNSDDKARKDMLSHVTATLDVANRTFDVYARRLTKSGWDLSVPVLETHSGSRIVLENEREREREI